MSFKKGDKLRVKLGKGVHRCFREGEIVYYHSTNEYGDGDSWIRITNVNGIELGCGYGWSPDRFEPVVPAIDFTKPVFTKTGVPVTILTTERRGSVYPVMGHVGESEYLCSWTLEGKLHTNGSDSDNDLTNEGPKKEFTVYMNVYADGAAMPHPTRSLADHSAAANRVACVKVTATEGQFDA